jgi:hypothetical protein
VVATQSQDPLTCAEKVNERKKNCKAEVDLPQMPVYSSSVNYYELYWEMYLRNEAVMQ